MENHVEETMDQIIEIWPWTPHDAHYDNGRHEIHASAIGGPEEFIRGVKATLLPESKEYVDNMWTASKRSLEVFHEKTKLIIPTFDGWEFVNKDFRVKFFTRALLVEVCYPANLEFPLDILKEIRP